MARTAAETHRDLVDFANRIVAESTKLGPETFGVKYLAELWLEAGLQLTASKETHA